MDTILLILLGAYSLYNIFLVIITLITIHQSRKEKDFPLEEMDW